MIDGMTIKFPAQLWRVSSDHDGESTVVLKVPQSHILEAQAVGRDTEVELWVTVEPTENKFEE